MKAMLCRELGPPEGLVLEDVPSPVVGPGTVRVRVRAAGVNFPDILMMKGEYQVKPPLPFAPGGEVAGEVLEVGPGVEGIAVGDRVMGLSGVGGFAEEAVCPGGSLLPIPEGMDDVTAAGLLFTYGTSMYALADRGRLQPGETLLVHGAAGGVGLAAVELGRAMGARVIATAGDDHKLAVVGDHGADHLINYRTGGFKETVKALTDGRGADVIYDPVGGDVFDESLRCINWDGRVLVIGFAGGRIPAAPANLVLLKSCSVVGVFWGAWVARHPDRNRVNFDRIFEWWRTGAVRPHVSHVVPLEKASDALYALVNREVIGKAIVEVA